MSVSCFNWFDELCLFKSDNINSVIIWNILSQSLPWKGYLREKKTLPTRLSLSISNKIVTHVYFKSLVIITCCCLKTSDNAFTVGQFLWLSLNWQQIVQIFLHQRERIKVTFFCTQRSVNSSLAVGWKLIPYPVT